MDIAKYVEFLGQYPAWFKGVIVVWLVAGAFLVGGLLLFRPSEPKKQGTLSAPTSPASVSLSDTATKAGQSSELASGSSRKIVVASTPKLGVVSSPDEYASKLRALSDRFLEKQEFLDLHAGAVIDWNGVVNSVAESQGSRSLHLTIRTLKVRPEMSLLVHLPVELRTKAFSLRMGDIVRIRGILTLSTPTFPDIEATDIGLVTQRTGG